MKSIAKALSFLLVAGLFAAPLSAQQTIVGPVDGTINSGGPGFGSLSQTFDQSGLSVGYTSGVDLFDTYLGLNPIHDLGFSGNEWFSNQESHSASVTYDLGSVMNVSRLALWNEDASGVGNLDLFGSTDGSSFFSLASGLSPTDHPVEDYPADVFSWSATDLRFVRFDMSDCPQPNGTGFEACAIGEVAFAAGSEEEAAVPGDEGEIVPVSEVPEPASALLLTVGLLGLGVVGRRGKDAA